MTTSAERWATLRDREATGEALRDDELVEISELERSDAIAGAFAAQIRELERHVRGRITDVPSVRDRELVDRALDAVQVTSQPLRTRNGDPDADLESAIDPEGPRWVRSGSMAMSVLLAAGAVVALATYEPRPVQHADLTVSRDALLPAPTVEALTTAHTAKRGGRLRRAGKALDPGETLSVGDVLRAAERPSCFVLEPSTTVCLAPLAAVRLSSLALKNSAVELLEGRAIVTHEGQTRSFELSAGVVRASTSASVFGLERSEDGTLRARVLDGLVRLSSPFGAQEVRAKQVALMRNDRGLLSVEPLPDAQAQREWELRATTLPLSALPARSPGNDNAKPAIPASITGAAQAR
jgi:hypothetical protein